MAPLEFMQRHIDGQLCGIEFCERYVSCGSNVTVDSSLRRMPAIALGDLTGCTAYQQSFEAVNIALDEVRRSWKVGLEVQLTLVHRSDWAGPAKKR